MKVFLLSIQIQNSTWIHFKQSFANPCLHWHGVSFSVLKDWKVQNILNNSPQYGCHQREMSFTDSYWPLYSPNSGYLVYWKLKAEVNSWLTANTHYRSKANRVGCLTVATIARIMHFNLEKNNQLTTCLFYIIGYLSRCLLVRCLL